MLLCKPFYLCKNVLRITGINALWLVVLRFFHVPILAQYRYIVKYQHSRH